MLIATTVTIKKLFNPENIKHVGEMREKYFSSGNFRGITGVRKEILVGWKLSYEHGFRGTDFCKPVVSDLPERLRKASQLLQVAVPYMEKIYSFLTQPYFWLTLLDPDGVIIKIVGSDEIISELAATGLKEGSDRGEKAPYCGLFNLVYRLNKPVIIVSTEQASPIDDNLAGAACPITDTQTNEILGYVAISAHWWDSHVHTLGLAIAAAAAISYQFTLKRANLKITAMNKSIKKINKELNTTIESVDFGLAYFNDEGVIKTINEHAISLLGINRNRNEIHGTHISDYIHLSMEKIQSHIKQDETYRYDLLTSLKSKIISKGFYPLVLFIKGIPNEDSVDYIMQIRKRAEFNQNAANTVYPHANFTFDDIIGQSREMLRAKELAQLAAQHDPAIMIVGESGTGKEMFAQAVHNVSKRATGPFIAINCGAIPRTLIESELFGYEKGAFTGADKNGHPGKFELANGGTLFLDEIGDMPYDVQVTLLRVLQTKEVLRIGGVKPIKVDVRIISATNKDLEEKIKNKTFRDDLYFRLNVFSIVLPSLRNREEDIEILANYLLNIYCRRYNKIVKGFTREAIHLMQKYDWPGNIRELENMIERSIIVCKNDYIAMIDLPTKLREETIPQRYLEGNNHISDKQEILEALNRFNNNMTKAAQYLGISRPTLYKKIKLYHIIKLNNIYS